MATMTATAFNTTATQKVAYDTVIGQRFKVIATVEYSLEDFQVLSFKHDIVKTALKVPIGLVDGKSGCAYLVLSSTELLKFTGDDALVQDEVDNPGSDATSQAMTAIPPSTARHPRRPSS